MSELPKDFSDSVFKFGALPDGSVYLCLACSRLGRCRLGITHEMPNEAGDLCTRLKCPADSEGGPGVAHGGWTAAVLDEISGHLTRLHHEVVVTASLNVSFLKPMPIERDLEGRSWLEKREGRRWYINAELLLAGTDLVLARSSAVCVSVAQRHFDQHQHWLNAQDSKSDAAGSSPT